MAPQHLSLLTPVMNASMSGCQVAIRRKRICCRPQMQTTHTKVALLLGEHKAGISARVSACLSTHPRQTKLSIPCPVVVVVEKAKVLPQWRCQGERSLRRGNLSHAFWCRLRIRRRLRSDLWQFEFEGCGIFRAASSGRGAGNGSPFDRRRS